MWTCEKCNEQHAAHFSTCWKCAGLNAPPPGASYVSARTLPGAGGDGLLGELGELFTSRERLEAYACPHCGSVEFFLEGVGTQHRVQTAAAAAPASVPAASSVEIKFREACDLEEGGQVEVAVARYEELATRYPGTNYARDAEARLRKIRERMNFQLRGEAFNAFNTPIYQGPDTGLTSNIFGRVTISQQNFPRSMQFAFRLQF